MGRSAWRPPEGSAGRAEPRPSGVPRATPSGAAESLHEINAFLAALGVSGRRQSESRAVSHRCSVLSVCDARWRICATGRRLASSSTRRIQVVLWWLNTLIGARGAQGG
jgi:hypothetical protein